MPASASAAGPVPPFPQRVKEAIVSLQFAWACGHLLTVISSVLYFRNYFNTSLASWRYTCAFIGAFVSYAVVVLKTFGMPQANAALAQKVVSNENVAYLVLTVVWMSNPIHSVALIPFFVFSSFHLLNYARMYFLPVLFPELKYGSSGPPGLPHRISKALGTVIAINNPLALYCVAYFELLAVMGSLIIGALRLNSIFALLYYVYFLRLRYALSPQSRRAFADFRRRLDALFIGTVAAAGTTPTPPRVPPVVTKAYVFIRDVLISYGAAGVATEPIPAGAAR